MKQSTIDSAADQPIPYTVTDPDQPIPYRLRVGTPSPELRAFVVPHCAVPTFSTPPVAEERPSGPRLKVA